MSNLEKCIRHTTLNQEEAAGCRVKEANYKRARKQTGIWKHGNQRKFSILFYGNIIAELSRT